VPPAPGPGPTPPGERALLQPSDFVYQGYYDLQMEGLDSPFISGLALRYVGGDLRLLTYHYTANTLVEISLTGHPYGDAITTETNSWVDPWGGQCGGCGQRDNFTGWWYEPATGRLFSTTTVDYTASFMPVALYTRTLNNDGTVGNVHGPIGFNDGYADIGNKRVYGGCQPVPQWFQNAYGTPAYGCGFGGYTSLMAQGAVASLGPTMYLLNDPATYGNGGTAIVKTGADASSGTLNATDWYAAGAPTTFDRGRRVTNPINYYDSGDPRPNPATPPTVPPAPGAQWLSPAPDGFGRFVWGDSYNSSVAWIDGPNKQGFVAFASVCLGNCYYMSSNLNSDERGVELHIFDPARFGEVRNGTRPAWQVYPASMTQLTLPGLGGFPVQGAGPFDNISAAAFDSTTGLLYLLGTGLGGVYNSRVYVFLVKD
jgi:hypothetical protein